jgi:propanediol dehydratase large subunit
MIIKAIKKINPNAEVSVDGENINNITWLNGTTPISKADIEAQLPIVELDMAMQDLRAKRNRLLTESDWTILPDSPIADKTAWQVYRQNLRDLTEGITTKEQANAVVFPTKP